MGVEVMSAANKLKRIREAYIKQLPSQLEALRKGYAELLKSSCSLLELENFHRSIHTLKGACASFGLKSVSTIAAAGEELAKEAIKAGTAPDTNWHQNIQSCLNSLEEAATSMDLSQTVDTRAIELVAASEVTGERNQKLIYFCEDDSYQRLSLSTQIECFGFKVAAFAELEQLSNAVQSSPPDAVIMDLVFPDRHLGGSETIESLRKAGCTVPVVFISSQNDFKSRLAAVRAGSSAYFTKPVNVTELSATLDALTNSVAPDPYRVLIVDDDPHLSDLYSTILQSAGMTTTVVNDPLQVMEPLLDFKPDLLLSDMYMPGCNGMELAKTVRQMGTSFSIPIIYLSSETDTGKQFQAMRMGGDEFLTKPISPENLVAAVAGRAGRMKAIRSFMVRDSMTGLFNHTTSKEYLEVEIVKAQRNGAELCFAMIDVDRFKTVNDSYGHQMGDHVLITLARLLGQRLRRTDIVGRYGGEEFAVILPDCNISEAVEIMDQLRESFAALRFPAGNESFSSTFSCGIAPLSIFKDVESVCKAADTSMYRAKEGGRNRVVAAKGGEK
ncbi:MAG: diguanylate cyclase [Desulfuromonadaceae bacterium]|nr:diguanylate cyclase [Desulfuromonadaceae bacterium]MDD2854607.1 diguanylate cyclase [Desulfuromonadaceae bacterium]